MAVSQQILFNYFSYGQQKINSGFTEYLEKLKTKMAISYDDEYKDLLYLGNVLEEFEEYQEVMDIVNNIKNIHGNQMAMERAQERMLFIMDQYQEQPHLLDPHLDSLLNVMLETARQPNNPPAVTHEAFRYLYYLTKVRGYKIIVRHMPHEVADLEPVLGMLSEQDPTKYQTWETRYVLLLWLSIVAMIPFDMAKLDSNITLVTGETKRPIMDRILDAAKVYLSVNDKCLDAAAYLVSRFMTRPDVQRQKLPGFIEWGVTALTTSEYDVKSGTVSLGDMLSTLRGVLSTIAALLKHGKREDLFPYAPQIFEALQSCKLNDCNSTVLRKLGIKITQRIGLTFLKARVAAWRYQRGSRSLADNLQQNTSGNCSTTSDLVHTKIEDDDDDEYDIPDEIEDVIEQLLRGLKDKDTVVRWSAAKGIGRVTGRLPQELADEVVGSVLELFTKQESDAAWHGGCLTLAELGRRGLLVPERLSEVVPVVLKSLNYDEKRGNFSVGAHVRDAACYVCWAFARAYEPEKISPYVVQISSALVIVSIFDREVNVRRAAAAAFQENVGRQGSFPHGIDILTTADYFAVGNRTTCYLELSVFVAKFSEYTQAVIDHLREVKIGHWDLAMRELTSQGLNNLTHLAADYMANTVIACLMPLCTGIDLNMRHGAILGVAEMTLACSKCLNNRSITEVLGSTNIDGLRDIAPKLQSAKLFRGLGGELMRKAVCTLIDRLSKAHIPFHGQDVLETWQDIIISCLQHIEPDIQQVAIAAIPAFFGEYFTLKDGTVNPEVQEKTIQKYLQELNATAETTRIGYALAMGALPKFMLHGKLKMVLHGLVQCTQITSVNKLWAESRRDAVKAITSVCKTVGIEPDGDPNNVLTRNNILEVYDCFLTSLTDYTLDSRGDVGSYVREASMTGLQELTFLVVLCHPDILKPQIIKSIFCSLVQQCCEKIDRTRAVAGEIFKAMLHHEPLIPHIPHYEELCHIFPQSDEIEHLNWAVPSKTFPRFAKLLNMATYSSSILLGLTVSVGGLTESLVKHSAASLMSHLRGLSADSLKLFAASLVEIFSKNIKVDRITIPMFKMLDQLLADGIFLDFIDDDTITLPKDLLTLSKEEISKSGDPQKLMASCDVFCGLLQFPGETQKKALLQLMIFLCHKYPRVRKTTSNKLYEALVTYDDVVSENNLEETLTILSETKWDEDLTVVRPIRNKLCDLLNIDKPVLLKKKDAMAK